MNYASPTGPIPTYLVTGFLGSGKTTLIASLLRQPGMKGTAVVVNEFGTVGIDDAIFAETVDPGKVRLLANGCLCCSAGDDLAATVSSLACLEQDRPNRIVIETTGLADPVPVIFRLMADGKLQEAIRLAGVITTVDAINGPSTLDSHAVARRQAAIADLRIVTKADLSAGAETENLVRRLTSLNPTSAIRVVSHGEISAATLLEAAVFDPFAEGSDPDDWMHSDACRSATGHQHAVDDIDHARANHDAVSTWLIKQEHPIEWSSFSRDLAHIVGRYGESILRLKGIIHTSGDPQPLVLHSVQRLLHPPVRLARSTYSAGTTIVVIGDENAQTAVDALQEAVRASALP